MRVITALVGIPVVVGLTWLGGWAFAGMVVAISVVAQFELYRFGADHPTGWGMGCALAAGASTALIPTGPVAGMVALVLVLASLVSVPLSHGVDRALPLAAVTVMGVVYPPLLLGSLTAIRLADPSLYDPFAVTLGIILLVWAADTGAYYVGRGMGRHLLAPVVSPRKTWEGFAGGVVGSVIVAVGWAVWAGSGLAVADWVALALVAGILGPAGDLFESSLKRSAGVKDSAGWLPGHGGLLDRFDALAFVAPAAWLYLRFVAG